MAERTRAVSRRARGSDSGIRDLQGAVPRDRTILDAAATLFYERGFHAVGVDAIGERAGVTGPAIYRHFSGKDEILATLFEEGLDRFFAALPPRGDDPADELRRMAEAHARIALENRELVGVALREGRALAPPFRRRLLRRERTYVDAWVDVLERRYPGRPATELLAGAHATIAMLNSVAYWPAGAIQAEDVSALVASFAVRGLEALAQPEPQPDER